jgi:hypothetical protein
MYGTAYSAASRSSDFGRRAAAAVIEVDEALSISEQVQL